jgi:ubiquinone/menaquinone biosynthesis C-methylase UbiE
MLTPKYDRIGIGYNQTRRADPYLTDRLYHHLQPQANALYLDIGCGTGNYTLALHRKGLSITGVDPAERMLSAARAHESAVEWKRGSAEAIPLASASVAGVLASLTMHHWADLNAAFEELCRVLHPGGRLVIFTSTPAQMRGYWLNDYFPQMLRDSIAQMPDLPRVTAALHRANLELLLTETYDVRPEQEDLFLYAGKDRPEMYLNPRVRSGISSFSDLALQEEIEKGLEQLAADIASGANRDKRAAYAHEGGDYLFLVARKRVE